MDDVKIEGAFVHATERAILVDCDGYEEWIPKSQIAECDDFEECAKGEVIELWIPKWLAQDKGLPYE